MKKGNASNATRAKTIATQTRTAANSGVKEMKAMTGACFVTAKEAVDSGNPRAVA